MGRSVAVNAAAFLVRKGQKLNFTVVVDHGFEVFHFAVDLGGDRFFLQFVRNGSGNFQCRHGRFKFFCVASEHDFHKLFSSVSVNKNSRLFCNRNCTRDGVDSAVPPKLPQFHAASQAGFNVPCPGIVRGWFSFSYLPNALSAAAHSLFRRSENYSFLIAPCD